jgi:hypothetical protein
MAVADVAQLGNLDELGDGFVNFYVKSAQPGVVQQGLVVLHQKMVELQIGRWSKDRDAKNIRRDFRDSRHGGLLDRMSKRTFHFDLPVVPYLTISARERP